MKLQFRLVTPAIALLITCLFSQQVQSADPLFPTQVGTRWVYQVGPVQVTEIITGINEIDGEQCIRLETRVNDQSLSYEHLALRPDGIYRVTVGGEKVVPPLCYFKSSARAGEKWSVRSKVDEVDVSGQFVAGKSLLNVPAGRYTVQSSHGTKFQSPSGELEFTYYYAPGVGKVKQVISVGGKVTQLELAEFYPATDATPTATKSSPTPLRR